MKQFSKRDVILMRKLSMNSRARASELGKELGCSRTTVRKIMSMLEKEMEIKYTLEVNESVLKDAQRHLITVSFTKKPSKEFLREFFKDEKYVHDVYLTEGAFDMLIYTRTADPVKYITWETYLAAELSDYGVRIRPCEIAVADFGFFPLNDDFVEEIGEKMKVDEMDKKLLVLLNQNSRMTVLEMSKRVRLEESTIRYRLFRMKAQGLIRKFTIAVQKPVDEYPMVYFATYRFSKGIRERMLRLRRLFVEHNSDAPLLNPFQIIAAVSGSYRSFGFTLFGTKEETEENVIRTEKQIFKSDQIKMECAKVTGVVKGLYPFRNDDMRTNYHLTEWR